MFYGRNLRDTGERNKSLCTAKDRREARSKVEGSYQEEIKACLGIPMSILKLPETRIYWAEDNFSETLVFVLL